MRFYAMGTQKTRAEGFKTRGNLTYLGQAKEMEGEQIREKLEKA